MSDGNANAAGGASAIGPIGHTYSVPCHVPAIQYTYETFGAAVVSQYSSPHNCAITGSSESSKRRSTIGIPDMVRFVPSAEVSVKRASTFAMAAPSRIEKSCQSLVTRAGGTVARIVGTEVTGLTLVIGCVRWSAIASRHSSTSPATRLRTYEAISR